MQKNTSIKLLSLSILGSILLASCGTIIGGSKYNAHVIVQNNPDAKIYYKNELKGTGTATFKVRRLETNKVIITVKNNGCQEQKFEYKSSSIRWGALIGSSTIWGLIGSIPIPSGLIIDALTGGLIKPDIKEKGIEKEDYKNFKYVINYDGCSNQSKQEETKVETKTLNPNTVYLKNGGVVKGTVTEQIPGVQIKLQTNDGNIFVYKTNEIEKITTEENSSSIDTIFLKNGSVLKGIIIEQQPNIQIKIKTKDGSLFVYKIDEIEKITK